MFVLGAMHAVKNSKWLLLSNRIGKRGYGDTNAHIQTPDIYKTHSSSGRRTENDTGTLVMKATAYRITSISTIIPDSVFPTVVKLL
jgi:hypothetical protein